MDQLKILKNLVSNMESTNSSMKNTLNKNHSTLSGRSNATEQSDNVPTNSGRKVLYPSSDLDLNSYKLSTKSFENFENDSDIIEDDISVCSGSLRSRGL